MSRHFLSALLLGLLASCATMDSPEPPEPARETVHIPRATAVDASAPLAGTAAELAGSGTTQDRASPTIYRGSNQPVRMPVETEAVNFVGEDVTLNFEEAPLEEVTHAILGEILRLDYMLDQPTPTPTRPTCSSSG